MELAGAAQRVIGMHVRMRSTSLDALGPHISCAAARALANNETTALYLVSVALDARPQAAKGLLHILESVVTGCRFQV